MNNSAVVYLLFFSVVPSLYASDASHPCDTKASRASCEFTCIDISGIKKEYVLQALFNQATYKDKALDFFRGKTKVSSNICKNKLRKLGAHPDHYDIDFFRKKPMHIQFIENNLLVTEFDKLHGRGSGQKAVEIARENTRKKTEKHGF